MRKPSSIWGLAGLVLAGSALLFSGNAHARSPRERVEPDDPKLSREEKEPSYLTLNAGMNDNRTLYLEVVPRPSGCQLDTRTLEVRLVLPNDVKIENIVQRAIVRKWAFTPQGYTEKEIELYPHQKYRKFAEAVEKGSLYIGYKPIEEFLNKIPLVGNEASAKFKSELYEEERIKEEELKRLAGSMNLVLIPRFFELIPGIYGRNISRTYQITCDRPVKNAYAIVTARVITPAGRSGYVKGRNLLVDFSPEKSK